MLCYNQGREIYSIFCNKVCVLLRLRHQGSHCYGEPSLSCEHRHISSTILLVYLLLTVLVSHFSVAYALAYFVYLSIIAITRFLLSCDFVKGPTKSNSRICRGLLAFICCMSAIVFSFDGLFIAHFLHVRTNSISLGFVFG